MLHRMTFQRTTYGGYLDMGGSWAHGIDNKAKLDITG